ncbi:YheC/YheD family protein [Paenibacillus sp. NFR01]|uniref:YheC/YheD family protein n=1 Tax=Paenibacillus sp. NFR01 TaxID=1566279 RepID=UPI0008CDD639|nr:YheC/YheD family protein [Paenibacillus sp. NFR01]SEU07985.1 YheC/D like ATP-grasp [Paenibacillus sp. NFR01]
MSIQRVSSKWAKTKVILQNPRLSPYIPETRVYTSSGLSTLLGLYETVYIKPDRGTYGVGVMRAERHVLMPQVSSLDPEPEDAELPPETDEQLQPAVAVTEEPQTLYILRHGKESHSFMTVEALNNAIAQRIQKRKYLIQQGIQLLCHERLPFDLRILTQKNPHGGWETTGMVGRVAAPQKIVTNYHNGGKVEWVSKLLKDHMSPIEAAATIKKLKLLGQRIGQQLESAYPSIKEIGLDVAIDEHHDLWLLEVNTLPAIFIFKQYPDKTVYEKIHRYASAYGRLKKNKPAATSRRKSPARRSSRR